MMSWKSRPGQSTENKNPDVQNGLLRTDSDAEAPKIRNLLRRRSNLIKDRLMSKKAKEKLSRNFVKAYAYRLYTSAWVTPLITVAVLTLQNKYHLSTLKTAFIQGFVEFLVKPFTYAAFEWGSSHITLGYVNNGKDNPVKKDASVASAEERVSVI